MLILDVPPAPAVQASLRWASPGVPITAAEVELHRRTSRDPDTWEDATDEVTESATIEQARDPNTTALVRGAEDRAVRVIFAVHPDSQPDVTDAPVPGTNYRVMLIVTRSGSGRKLARSVELRILP